MNDIKFLEKYNVAAIDNFVLVVKQNILFQAQVAYLSEQVAHVDELKKQIVDFELVKESLIKLKEDNANLTNELHSKITIIESANKSDAEKYRLQTSLNEQSREIEQLKNGMISLQEQVKEQTEQVKEQTEYIAKLEEIKESFVKLKEDNINLTTELNNKIMVIESVNKSDAEKYRLQTSLNDQSREIDQLKNGMISLQEQAKQKTEYIVKLEEMLPKTAKKKLGITQEIIGEEIKYKEGTIDNALTKPLSAGGSF